VTARTTDDAIVMEGETDKGSSGGGIIIQVAPSAAGVASKLKIPPQKSIFICLKLHQNIYAMFLSHCYHLT
jgi:hypothetical protein